ncbi:TIGR01459 family HAD-type hydrolase [Arsenicitalea aurantiaca]|uniref:TIGR01459 family HAD-type hydrolase n=1 Tax=Arsenicitalea aurantiaca TaxID=1783274 RepID=UPI0013150BE5|nr:TIGR01459 family HAD-type hydrolase [Arsenicitalea aurantiaca]
MNSSAPLGALTGLSALAPRYTTLFCDVWGVVHNGIAAHPTACAALVRFREAGGTVIFVTNSPRPSGPILAMLDRLGVPRGAFDALVSSGDATRAMIGEYRGRVIHHIGPPSEDDALYEGLGVIRGPAETAETLVVTDLDTDDDTPEMYEERIALWRARDLPMIAANPDKFVEIGDQLIYCGGALADLYAERGGRVRMAGKPYAPIYEEALKLATRARGAEPARAEILAVGDSVRTDATGAAGFGIDFLFIAGSIHAEELDAFGALDPAGVGALVAPSGANMVGYMARLGW